MRRTVTLGLVAGLLMAVGSGQAVAAARPAAIGTIDTQSRASVVSTYRDWLEPLLSVPVGWTGSIDGCRAGRTSAANQRATLSAVNYMRALAGVPPVRLDPVRSRQSQQAALIMAANGYLTHTPSRDMKCWTKAGYAGASHGNLYLAWSSGGFDANEPPSEATGARAVVGYLIDDGDNNSLAGHRRWLLYQQLTVIGSGDTSNSNSIYVLPRAYLPPKGSTWVSWPSAGYFPRELEPKGRWSLSYPGADFRRAKVTVMGPEGRIKARRQPVANGYGDNTLVWELRLPAGYSADPAADYAVSVRVTGIRLPSGDVTSRSWRTTFVAASAGPVVNVPTPAG